MKKNILLAGFASLVLLVGCEDKKTSENSKPSTAAQPATQQNIMDYTKILKLNEPVEINDPQNYTPNTIEYAIGNFIKNMSEGKWKDCKPLMISRYDDPTLKMWYDNRFKPMQWDFSKKTTLTLHKKNGNYSCLFEGFSGKRNKNQKASYYIVIQNGKVLLSGSEKDQTFQQ